MTYDVMYKAGVLPTADAPNLEALAISEAEMGRIVVIVSENSRHYILSKLVSLITGFDTDTIFLRKLTDDQKSIVEARYKAWLNARSTTGGSIMIFEPIRGEPFTTVIERAKATVADGIMDVVITDRT